MNYTVLGATVNMAARLEPLNKEHGTEILVSETVARRAAEVFDFRFVAEVDLKGDRSRKPVDGRPRLKCR